MNIHKKTRVPQKASLSIILLLKKKIQNEILNEKITDQVFQFENTFDVLSDESYIITEVVEDQLEFIDIVVSNNTPNNNSRAISPLIDSDVVSSERPSIELTVINEEVGSNIPTATNTFCEEVNKVRKPKKIKCCRDKKT